MLKFFISLILTLMMFLNCAKCSKDTNTDENIQQSSYKSIVNNNQESVNTEPSQNQSDRRGETNIIDPKVRFVQTPDGKVVPEAILKLKLPKLLNPDILKNVAQESKQSDESENSKKEEK